MGGSRGDRDRQRRQVSVLQGRAAGRILQPSGAEDRAGGGEGQAGTGRLRTGGGRTDGPGQSGRPRAGREKNGTDQGRDKARGRRPDGELEQRTRHRVGSGSRARS